MGMHKSGRNDTKTPGASVKQDKTLADYIARKQERSSFETMGRLRGEWEEPKKKLTFNEWYVQSGWAARHAKCCSGDDADSAKYIMECSWEAAQENV